MKPVSLTVFAFALLTERAIVIEGGDFSTVFESNYIDWSFNLNNRALAEAVSGSREAGDEPFEAMKDCDANDLLMQVSEWDLNARFPTQFVNISTNTLWWPRLFQNPRYAKKVKSWGLDSHDSFFGCAMQYLFQPQNAMASILYGLQEKMRGKFTVGLQLRLNEETGQVRPGDVSNFLACGSVLAMSQGFQVDADDVRWIVSTDVPDAVVNLQEQLGQDAVIWYDAPQDDGTGRRTKDEKVEIHFALKRAVDHWLLSLANVTIISFASTFGLSAAQFQTGARPHYSIGRHYHQPWKHPECERRHCSDSDPCFHKAFGYFGLCDKDLVYSHGQAFLDEMAERFQLTEKRMAFPTKF